MKMKKVRALALLLGVALLAGTVAGCGSDKPSEDSGQTTDGKEELAEGNNGTADGETESTDGEGGSSNGEIVTLTAWTANTLVSGHTSLNQMDTHIGKLIAEETGVAINATYMNAASTAEEAFNLLLSGGGYEDYDIIMLPSGNPIWQEKLIATGGVIPLDDYFTQSDKYPNIAAIPEETIEVCRSKDGKLYGFPHNWYEDMESKYGFWASHGWYVFPQYLEAVGMTAEDLKDLAGVEAFLKSVKEQGLTNADGQTVQPLSMGESGAWYPTILGAFGVGTAGNGFYEVNGEMVHFRDNPNTKAAMQWMNRLYNQGLIDPEFITQKNDQLQEKIMTQRVGMVATDAFNFWSAVTVGENEATQMEILDFPLAEGVSKVGTLSQYDPYGVPALYVTKNCKDPDAVARLVDYFAKPGTYSQWTLIYGPRGTTWDWDEERGEPYLQIIDETLNEALTDYNAMTEYGYQTTIGVAPFDKDLNYYRKENELQLSWIFDMHRSNAEVEGYAIKKRDVDRIQFSAEGAYNTNFSILKQLDTDYFCRMVACSESEFETIWNEYQTQLEQQGHWTEVKAEFDAEYANIK